jgi:hypothetical protein
MLSSRAVIVAFVAALGLLAPAAAPAQEGARHQNVAGNGSSSADEASGQAALPQPVDARKLPVSLERLQRRIRESVEREERNGPAIRYTVDVFGRSPRIELFRREDNLVNSAIPYGAPTHQEMMDIVTPKEFRSPAMDFGNLLRWLKDRAK